MTSKDSSKDTITEEKTVASATNVTAAPSDDENVEPHFSQGQHRFHDTALSIFVGSSIQSIPLKIYIKTPTGSTLSFQLSSTDSNIELKQLLIENLETCYLTSFDLSLNGEHMPDFSSIGDTPNMKSDVTIDMQHAPYDEKSAREQVYRLRELLSRPLDQCYLASGNIEKLSDRKVKSFPSLTSIIEREFPQSLKPPQIPAELEEMIPDPMIWPELATALDVDHEINSVNNVIGRGALSNINGGNTSTKNSRKSRKNAAQSLEFDSNLIFKTDLQSFQNGASRKALQPSLTPLSTLMSVNQPPLHRCVEQISFSAWNPPPPPRKMMGDLFYLEIKTIEGDSYHVTANGHGFYVNGTKTGGNFDPNPLSKKSKQSQTLLGLIWDLSVHVRRDFPRLMLARMKRHAFEVSPLPFPVPQWLSNPVQQTYSPSRLEDFMCNLMGVDWRMQQREWNEEYQSCRELPTCSPEENIIRDRTVFKIHCDFVEASIRGAKAVVEQNLVPINPLDPKPAQVFIQNQIFFSFALDDDLGEDINILKAFDLDKDTYSKASNDLKGVIAFNKVSSEKIHTLATTIVDYMGYRVVAQSLIPGILQGDQSSKHIYGNVEEKIEEENTSLLRLTTPLKPHEIRLKKEFVWNEEYHEVVKKCISQLYVKEHTITDTKGKNHKFAGPAECKGIIGSDGRYYILDLVGLFPRDTNFLENETAFIRPELIEAYISKMQKSRDDSSDEKPVSTSTSIQQDMEAEEAADSTDEDTQERKCDFTSSREFVQSVLNEEQKTPGVAFNPNTFSSKIQLAGSEEEIKSDEDEVRKLGNFLINEVIPNFVAEVKNLEFVPLDGPSLTHLMHNAGINMRYLGKLAMKAAEEKLTFLEKMAQQEMIVRCAKHEFNRMLRRTSSDMLAKSVESFLNSLLSYKEFSSVSRKKKKTDVAQSNNNNNGNTSPAPEYKKGRAPIISSRLLRQHLIHKIKSKFHYNLPESVFAELPRFSTLRSFCLRTGLKIMCRDFDFSVKAPFQMTDVLDLQPLVKHSTPDSQSAQKLLTAGRNEIEKGHVENAFECLSQAMIMFQQVKGGLNQEVAECFNLLATLLFQVSDLGQAVLHQHKAFLICRRVEGVDSANLVQMHQLMGMLCNHLGQSEMALKHFYRAKYFCELICGFETPDLAVIESNIATMVPDPEESLKFFESALEKNKRLLGEHHPNVSQTYHSMALTYSSQRDFKTALHNEREAYKILKELYGADSPRTKEAAKFMEVFTSKAVEMQNRFSRSKLKDLESINRLLTQSKRFDQELFSKNFKQNFGGASSR